MNPLNAFIRLIRFPNLVFIALTQVLFYFCIVIPHHESYPGSTVTLTIANLVLLVIASVLIAGAGYVINDYFDLNIDRINKPERLVVEKLIKRRWAILWHFSLSAIGLLISIYLSWKTRSPLVGIFNFLSIVLLWFYSTNFKKQVLIGNVIISLLTAWVVLVIYVCEAKFNLSRQSEAQIYFLTSIYKMAVVYGGFAFIISLIREVVKDIEDMEGDMRYQCKTLPIVWGMPSSKMFVAVWLIILMITILILQLYAFQLQWWWMILYNCLLILLPLIIILGKLLRAKTSKDFGSISTMIKGVMFAGILSMIFFKFYN
ncbi:geranylgeranylglycerol-phosphate geranylgeranyltransferase [Pollutibacter soli]|uniref:geranylgeranylglycerol-phosphate geranylgeranyltransferase n=1 Tax=Pollutibacter soli TaxID=3034157 RepID=UPI003013EAFE